VVGTSPALHILPKSIYGACDEARALMRAARAVRYTEELAPVMYGRKLIGSVYGDRYGRVFATKENALDLMGFPGGYVEIVDAIRAGKTTFGIFMVLANGGIGSNLWADLWNTQGTSLANSYSGTANTARQFDNTSDGRIYIGEAVSPATKHLVGASMAQGTGNTTGMMFWVYDRVLSYDKCTISNATQTMTNTLTAQRWTGSGFPGLRILCTLATTATGVTASHWTSIIYANEVSTAGKTVPLNLQLDMPASSGPPSNSFPAPVIAQNLASAIFDVGPFFALNKGDIGVSSLTSYVFSAANTGDLCYALVRPLVMFVGPPTNNVATYDFVRERLVLSRIYDTSCLSLMMYDADNNASTATYTGNLQFAWN
jgi:hypothetical protein